MVDFHDIVSADALATGLTVNGKKQLFQKIATLVACAYGLDADEVGDALFERETLDVREPPLLDHEPYGRGCCRACRGI